MSGRRTELPAMPDCTGCGECCTVVKVRPDEAKRIRHHVRTNGVEWSPPEHQPEDWASRGDEGPNRYCGFLPCRLIMWLQEERDDNRVPLQHWQSG